MAAVSGFGGGFNAEQFRTAIKNTMRMGAPQDTAQRATFRWKTIKTHSRGDRGGKPWDLTATPTAVTERDDVQVDVAVEFSARTTLSGGTPIGEFDTPRAVITVLDEDYELIEGANFVLLGGNTYKIDFIAPPIGLFTVTVWQIYASAVDET